MIRKSKSQQQQKLGIVTMATDDIKSQKKGHKKRIPVAWILSAVTGILYVIQETYSLSSLVVSPPTYGKNESLLLWDWRDAERGSMKQHMEFVRMETEVTDRGNRKHYADIEYVHQNGLLHTGVVAAVIDSNITQLDAKILLLKRSPQLVTCPNSWSVMGEHTYRDETPKETAIRGLREELGDALYQLFLTKGGKILPLVKHPVYFKGDYGHGRIDRQMTFLYAVEMNTPLNVLRNMLQLDEEVADAAWMTRQEIQDGWMNYNPREKFCNHEMTIFLQLVLHRIEDLEREANAHMYAAQKAAEEEAKQKRRSSG